MVTMRGGAERIKSLFVWLMIDHTILVAGAETYGRAIEFLKISLLWGAWLCNPVVDVFATSPSYRVLAGLFPARVWGLGLFLAAAIALVGAWGNRLKIKRWGMVIAGLIWGVIAFSMALANPLSTAPLVYSWVSFSILSWSIIEKHNIDQEGGNGF